MHETLERFGGQLMVLAIIVLIALGAALSVRGRRPGRFGLDPAPAGLALGSAAAIAVATLTRQAGAHAPGRLNLDPFHTMRSYLGDPSALAFYLAGNVALFVPLGFFLHLALRRGPILPFILTVLASAGVEIAQLPIWSRSTDVDDVLLNSLGGLIGVLAAAAFVVIADRAQVHRLTRTDEPAEIPLYPL